MKKKVISIDGFMYEKDGLSLKALLKQVYDMDENKPKNSNERISLDPVKKLLSDKGYINVHTGKGDQATALGVKNGFSTKGYMSIEYIQCDPAAQEIVLEILQGYINDYNSNSVKYYEGVEDSIHIDSSSVTGDQYYTQVNAYIKTFAADIPATYIGIIVNEYLTSKGYMYTVPEELQDQYEYLPTEKGKAELRIRLIEFTNPDTVLKPTYLIYSPEAQEYIYDNFPEMLKCHNNPDNMCTAA